MKDKILYTIIYFIVTVIGIPMWLWYRTLPGNKFRRKKRMSKNLQKKAIKAKNLIENGRTKEQAFNMVF